MVYLKHFIKACWQPSLYFFSLFLIAVAIWVNKFFGPVSVDQLIYTFIFSLQGSLNSDPVYQERFIKWCIYIPLGLTVIILAAKKWLQVLSKYRLYRGLFVMGFILLAHQFMVYDYIRGYFGPDYFKSNYRDPKNIHFTAHHPKSLVLIYVESLETTYSNKRLFKQDLLKTLNILKAEGVSFPRYQQVQGTSWSIAGIVATQCGIPLKSLSIYRANSQGQMMNHFLPNAKCLSDILAEQGYRNIFMNGSSLAFGGLDIFLKDHHYDEMIGSDEWLSSGMAKQSDMIDWGLPDDQLMARAKIKLGALIKQDKPFNLTLFTINTHGPYGTMNHLCRKSGYKNFTGIVQCTANEVADLVLFIKQNSWLDKVNVVVVGDHLAMENPVYNQLTGKKHRYVFNMLLSKQKLMANTKEIVPFDMFPTILESLGITYNGNRVGLGYSALLPHQAIEQSERIKKMESHIGNRSQIYNQLWLTPEVQA